MVTLVPVYAGLFALVYIYLATRVIGLRRTFRVALGHGGHSRLERAQRAHGNFAEYVPFALLLLTFVEMRGANHIVVHLLCLALLAARLLHAYNVAREHEIIRLRVVAMATTFGVYGIAAAILVFGGFIRAAGGI
jgi:uncharacterized membrane protein YecN with MAPEG domain